MKKITLLVMVTLTIGSVSIFAQDTTKALTQIQDQQSEKEKYFCPIHSGMLIDKEGKCAGCLTVMNRSKKELMKMEVMKIYPVPIHTNITTVKPGTSSSYVVDNTRSKKEQMKMEVMKIYNAPLQPQVKSSKPGTCATCLKYNNRSKKEQMKMEVMKIPKCTVH